ncbi:MAG: 16S rRNA processing protein RimM [Acidobacteria bacterium]|nr:16S rRNA processing protein RimM [Acidobacteriota bacterium]
MILDRPVHRRYMPGLSVQVDARPYRLLTLRPHQDRAFLQLDGITTMDLAEALRGAVLSVAREDVPLEPGEYLLQDLIGCDVIDDATGQLYGEVDDWQETGLQTLLEVNSPAVQLLIPLVPAICIAIRPADRLIRVTLPEGLAQLNVSPAAP